MTKREFRKALEGVPLGEWPNRLNVALTIARISTDEAAAAIGVSGSLISRIANPGASHRRPTPAVRAALADFLGVPERVLFPLNQDEPEKVSA